MYKYNISVNLGNKLLSYQTNKYEFDDLFIIFVDKIGKKRQINKNNIIEIVNL